MKVNGTPCRSIRDDDGAVAINDERWLPHDFRMTRIETLDDFAVAIRDMWVRGAPLIGVTAAYGMARQMARDPTDASLDAAWEVLHATRPTAINLKWALDMARRELAPLAPPTGPGPPSPSPVAWPTRIWRPTV